MAGELDQGQHGQREAKSREVAVKVRNLSSGQLLQDIDLDIRYGEILGIAGLIGAGRTELLRAIFGADKINCGTLSLDDDEDKLMPSRMASASFRKIAHGKDCCSVSRSHAM
jgi:ribose transport system ATP-binding protein